MGRKGFQDKVTVKVNLERSEFDEFVKVAPNGNLSNFIREIIKGYVGQSVEERPAMKERSLGATTQALQERQPIVEHHPRCCCAICVKARTAKK